MDQYADLFEQPDSAFIAALEEALTNPFYALHQPEYTQWCKLQLYTMKYE